MVTLEQKEEFNKIFKELGKSLDITEVQHNAAVTSYEFVGEWLAQEGSSLSPYEPEIVPQGSFMLGTMTKPIHEEDELDIDLVCQLKGKVATWTQYDLKKQIGDRLKDHGMLKRLLDEEGRRCWTLKYADSAKFHLDILPSIISENYKVLLERSFSVKDVLDTQALAIRITDKETDNYYRETNSGLWLKSNPLGYGAWFKQRASLDINKAMSLREAVQPVPAYEKEKLPLQVVVQILKRHRDLMYNGDCDKPISIIITTLAALAYQKQTNVAAATLEVVQRMASFIEDRYDLVRKRYVKWIANPINPEENFADKWPDEPQKEKNFYNWLERIQQDVLRSLNQHGLYRIQESLSAPFGNREVSKAFEELAIKARVAREEGHRRMAAGTGILGSVGTKVANHNFHGRE
ncbi:MULTISPECIES: nucleotidyltransferase domain-containing protein [Dyadobacter]|uniref:Cyclic GMP-AMP synthase n=1 Tax=Dyadobacter psychrotolerans TaxID=2541721 RepID=A0A4R5DH81_9BACT|nr:nucleotidyltransferase [Dyadobacter psychrotolerans]TDE13189.1 nucleotidyltransferase [Dyadobacter psychrotolerans]